MDLFKLLGSFFNSGDLLTANSGDPDFEKNKVRLLQGVKLVHCSDLHKWNTFPKYQQYEALNYYEYLVESEKLNQLKRKHSHVTDLHLKLIELADDEVKVYKSFTVDVAPSLFWKTRLIDLEKPTYENTVVTVSKGKLEEGKLLVKAKWFKDEVYVTYASPACIQHAEQITLIREKLAGLDAADSAALREIQESRFSHPVLFVSHRWETTAHPDPAGNQLKKLLLLENCFIIYDYCSFPQDPLSSEEACDLQCILKHMSRLIHKVVILHSPDYVDRGWCIYEYIAASLLGAVVCDEIQDSRFVALRNWVATRVPFPTNLFRDSWESQQQNYINEKVLFTVNEILPLFKNSFFTVEQDRSLVRALLLNLLKSRLPPKKEHQQYLGEWKTTPWTKEELADAFEHELKWEAEISVPRPAFDMDVPDTIREAVQRRYKINQDTIFKRTLY